MNSRVALAWTCTTLVLALAACGDDKSDDSKDASTTTGERTASQPKQADVKIDDGRITLRGADVGDVDLTKLPMGDDKLSESPTKGELYLCPEFGQGGPGGGAQVEGPWIHGDTWSLKEKLFVSGEKDWPDAEFTQKVSGDKRVLTGNNLPVDHKTGEFPVSELDPVAEYDRNPSEIKANAYEVEIPAEPKEASEPQCVGGEAGFLTSGVILNSPVDAEKRDAPAHEGQDSCFGHPNDMGYHYHEVTPCIEDPGTGHSKLVGYAFDGFGIYGHRGEGGKPLTNDDLDECHGHVGDVDFGGKRQRIYHYHATWEFPYAVGCFKGTSSQRGPPFQNAGQGGPPTGGPPGGGPP